MDWIKQFTDMIFPLNRDQLDIEGAYLLKNQHLPSSIFKYREINDNSLKNLEEDTVWLADPSTFNDPYDCAHSIDLSRVDKYLISEHFEKLMKEIDASVSFTNEQKRQIESSRDPIIKLTDILLSRESSEKAKSIRPILSDLEALQGRIYEDWALDISKKVASSFKLCSFSERNDSMLMWAHYASYHQGFCVEYDLEKIPSSDFRRRFLYPTIYSDKVFDATEYLIKEINDDNFNNLYMSLAGLVKAKDWAYEKEWRLIFAHGIFNKGQAYKVTRKK